MDPREIVGQGPGIQFEGPVGDGDETAGHVAYEQGRIVHRRAVAPLGQESGQEARKIGLLERIALFGVSGIFMVQEGGDGRNDAAGFRMKVGVHLVALIFLIPVGGDEVEKQQESRIESNEEHDKAGLDGQATGFPSHGLELGAVSLSTKPFPRTVWINFVSDPVSIFFRKKLMKTSMMFV